MEELEAEISTESFGNLVCSALKMKFAFGLFLWWLFGWSCHLVNILRMDPSGVSSVTSLRDLDGNPNVSSQRSMPDKGTLPSTVSPSQTTTNASAVCDTGIAADLVLMVDTSQHTLAEHKDLKDFLLNVLSNLKISDYCTHVGLVVFSSKAEVIVPLNTGVNKTIVEKHIGDIQLSTEKIVNTGGAINYTKTKVFGDTLSRRKNQGIQQLTVLISHKPSADSVVEAAYLLRRENVRIFTVGISQANQTQMNQIASHPRRNYQIKANTFSDLSKKVDILQKKIVNVVERDIIYTPRQSHELKLGCQKTDIADIYLLIDSSGSIDPLDFKTMKAFLMELIDMFEIGPQKVRIAVMQYSDDSQEEISIGNNYDKINLKLKVQEISQIGKETYTGKAINFTSEIILDPSNVRAGNVPVYLILFTDGASKDSVKEASIILRQKKVNMYAIGVKEAKQSELLEIAGDPKRVYFVNNFDSLKDIKNLIAIEICSSEVCQKVQADVMFLVASSASIGTDNFIKMKDFMKSLVTKTDVGPDNVQFGIVQFSDVNVEVLPLSKEGTKTFILESIEKMVYMANGTYTGKALEFVSRYFTESKGARPKVKKLLILITDGKAQDDVKLQSESLRNSGVNIISVGIFNANKAQLEEISGPTGQVHYVESFETLKFKEEELLVEICKEGQCTYEKLAVSSQLKAPSHLATLQRYRQRSESLQRRCLVAGELSHRPLSSDQRCR
ncbi:unnamed protein product [Ranitomeya imitator]|uniref:VWFA domain-containing protein n=1 Tax=Ranitomeya imitator TaxID=111125 RepID=A0ABN9M3R7_9NEOB|nr:unnamed protein product [Ranitomeya imitator]